MATPMVIRYPLDPTGTNPNNLIIGEQHTLLNRNVRAIALRYGAFFAESVVINDLATNKPLTKSQYVCSELYELPTTEYGKEVYALLLITDTSVSNNVSVNYQAVGGPYSASVEAIISQIEQLNLDLRPVAWPSIIGKPVEYNPAHHLHDIGDTYGWEYVVHAINRLRDAIIMGDSASHDAILSYIDRTRDALLATINTGGGIVSNHLVDFNNPHKVTAEQTGAYTKSAVDALLASRDGSINSLLLHMADHNNPHGTTAAQVGAYSIAEIDTLINNVKDGANSQLAAHLADTNNPHRVTAAQLGVYTKTEIDSRLSGSSAAMSAHVTDTNNPHGVTAAQVGLGNVQNFPMASTAESLSNRTDLYLSPANLSYGLANHNHDGRYVRTEAGNDGAITTDSGGFTYVWQGGKWNTLRSSTLNWDNFEALVLGVLMKHFRFEY